MTRAGAVAPAVAEPTPTMKAKQIAVVALGLASSAAFVWLAVSSLDLREVGAALGRAHVLPWLPLALLSYLIGHVVRGMRCRLLVSREAALTLPTATNVVVLGYAVNNILPARLGEFARAGMLAERSGLPFVQSLTVTFLERILDGFVLLLFLVVIMFVLPADTLSASLVTLHGHEYVLGDIVRPAVVVFVIAGVGIAVAIACPGYLIALASRTATRLAPRFHDPVVRLCGLIVNGVAYLRRPRDACLIGVLSAVVWLFEAGLFLFVLPAFDLRLSLPTAVLCMTVTNLAILLPSTPGFIGLFHYFCAAALALTGVGHETALGFAFVVHLVFFIPITVWGVLVLMSYGVTLSETLVWRKQARRLKRVPDQPVIGKGLSRAYALRRRDAPTPFMICLTEAVIAGAPEPAPVYDHHAALMSVAGFVHGQIRALPMRLRIMFAAGMWGVRVATRLRFLQSFCALPVERRARWVESWAYGRFALGRQLLRGVRSTALLALYEIEATPTPTPTPAVPLVKNDPGVAASLNAEANE